MYDMTRPSHLPPRMVDDETAEQYLYLVMDIGQYMLQCGGEISRVEDSIQRMGLAFGAQRVDAYSITTCITVTAYADSFGAVTQIHRVGGTQCDLTRLEKLNQLSRRICTEGMDLDQARAALEAIRADGEVGLGSLLLIYALVSASFTLFFGGSAMDAAASGLVGILLKYLESIIRKTESNAFLSSLLCSVLGGLLAAGTVAIGFGQSAELISIGNIMLLIPGIALTNSLRDMFSGNPMSGMLRFLESIILALVIALGFALVASMV